MPRGLPRSRTPQQVSEALALLDEMQGLGIEPDVVSFNTGINACEKANKWSRATASRSEIHVSWIS